MLPREIRWVIEGVLASSGRPGFPNHSVSTKAVDQWIARIDRLGVRSVICMLSEDEEAVYYRRLRQSLVDCYSEAGLQVRQVSYEDMGVAVTLPILVDRVLTAFAILPKPVLVHCSAGVERSQLATESICHAWNSAKIHQTFT